MIPKVATHILHHTSRAAAAVQNQTTQTIRNVLQLQTSGSGQPAPSPRAGSSSSHWSHNGPGPGGAKFNTNGRFYAGYSGVGRAVTQANVPSMNDVTTFHEDTDEPPVKRSSLTPRRIRQRSHSLSNPSHGRVERSEPLGVLKTVQIHARNKHAFATLPSSSDDVLAVSEKPTLVRRNSTSASELEAFDASGLPPVPPASSAPLPLLDTDPARPQTATPPLPPLTYYTTTADYEALKAARDYRGDNHAEVAVQAVRNFRFTTVKPSVAEFNMALEALYKSRHSGEPLNLILEIYNDILKHSLLPNTKTYCVLIMALTDRDHEVQKIITQLKMKGKRVLFASDGDTSLTQNEQKLASESNFQSAMSLFEALLAINGNSRLPLTLYESLLRSCAQHCNTDAAIHVYAQLERRTDLHPSPVAFLHMMSVYANTGDLQGAKAIFAEFRAASKEGRLSWALGKYKDVDASEAARARHMRSFQVQVWNKMIEAYFRCGQAADALTILEEMMDSKADPSEFGPTDIPPPASSTFTNIISGLCNAGDVKSALVWFDRLLGQSEIPVHPFQSMAQPPQPDALAWAVMMEKLSDAGLVSDLNRLYLRLASLEPTERLQVRVLDRALVFNANISHASQSADSSDALATLDFLVDDVLTPELFVGQQFQVVGRLVELYLEHNQFERSVSLVDWYVSNKMQKLMAKEANETTEYQYSIESVKRTSVDLTTLVVKAAGSEIPFLLAIRLMHTLAKLDIRPPTTLAPFVLHSYALAKQQGTFTAPLSSQDWSVLGYASSLVESGNAVSIVPGYAFEGTVSLLVDMADASVDLALLEKDAVDQMFAAVQDKKVDPRLQEVISRFGPAYASAMNADAASEDALSSTDVDSWASQDTLLNSPSPVIIDMYHNRSVDEFFHAGSRVDVHTAYQRFQTGMAQDKYPTPITLGHLITALGRTGDVDKVRHLYSVAQKVLTSLEENKKWQTQSWFVIEDAMVIALAHAGDLEAAHVHRVRMLEQGGAPTADAYGALIQYVKDTTDDTSSALALFQEAEMHNVRPNIYLYNNVISKLAKARKADYALELFQQMKRNRIQPSSITYGALIAACARVGDHHSAEQLFLEMTQQKNFKPRIPPYNTMMQLYTSTKPNRERALYYYESLLAVGVTPTAHTYKLLIDAYGTMEPLDLESVDRVFKTLEHDPKVEIQGSHWAAIINAYGCAAKDLNKAIEIFDSIATHPKTRLSPAMLPDAVCYEAMINVLVMHRQTDLMQKYIQQLHDSGVHMTAYIANFLIKGHAIIGDLDQARSIFESLYDPPIGMAAPNNHVPHDPAAQSSSQLSAGLPVYREPSTWEVMVRAELGAGNRENAIALLERLRTRHYPEAVYNRISGIMLDDSVSPWAADTFSVHSQ